VFCAIINIHEAKKAVAANHVPPTQRVIVTSCIRPAYAFVTSWKITTRYALVYFILLQRADVALLK